MTRITQQDIDLLAKIAVGARLIADMRSLLSLVYSNSERGVLCYHAGNLAERWGAHKQVDVMPREK